MAFLANFHRLWQSAQGARMWVRIPYPSVSSKLMQDSINQKIVSMAGVWHTAGTWADGDNVTCKEGTARAQESEGPSLPQRKLCPRPPETTGTTLVFPAGLRLVDIIFRYRTC
jgi:hypothetical protein